VSIHTGILFCNLRPPLSETGSCDDM